MSDNQEFHVIKAEVNPIGIPPLVGVHWVNTALKTTYLSVGTASANDWILQTSGIKAYADLASFPVTGAIDALYLAQDTCTLYCWNGSAYVKTKADEANLDAHIADTSNPHSVTAAQTGAEPANANIQAHIIDTSNPHVVTKAQVGLGNAENTSDLDKVVSTATQTVLDLKADQTSLDSHTTNTLNPHSVTASQVGAYTSVQTDTLLNTKADKTNVLEKDNTTLYTPALEYHPATKKYVDDELAANSPDWGNIGGALSNQTDLQNALDLKASITYVDNEIDAALASVYKFISDYDASTNIPDLTTFPNSIKTGFAYVVTVAGTFFGENLEIGDQLICKSDNPSNLTGWARVQKNLDAASIKTAYESNADTNAYTDAEKTKLAGIEALAEVNNISDINATDLTDNGDSTLHYHASDRDRANHTGEQAISTVTGLQTALDGKEPTINLATNKIMGRVAAGSGTWSAIGIDGGLEFFGNNLRRSALIGDIEAAAGSNTTTLSTSISNAIALNTAKVSNVDHPLVETAVPVGAVFTDTVYDDTVISAAVALNTTHRGLTNNPHAVTATQVGLGNVDNTADLFTKSASSIQLVTPTDILGIGSNPDTNTRLHVKGLGSTSTTYALKVENSSSARLFVVRDDGGVGVNQLSPTARLHVKGAGATSATYALKVDNSTNTSLLAVRDDGKIGVGTLAPTGDIHILRSNGPRLVLDATGGNVTTTPVIIESKNSGFGPPTNADTESQGDKWIFWNASNFKGAIGFDNATMYLQANGTAGGNIKLYTGNTNTPNLAFWLDGTGGLSLGTGAAATARLHVKGAGTTSATYALKVENSTATSLLSVRDDGLTTFRGNINLFNSSHAILDITPDLSATSAFGVMFVGAEGKSWYFQLASFGSAAGGARFGQPLAKTNELLSVYSDRFTIGTLNAAPIYFGTSNVERMQISSAGVVKIANLAGTGTRNVVVDAAGNLSAP